MVQPGPEEPGKEPFGPACRDYFWVLAKLVENIKVRLVENIMVRLVENIMFWLVENIKVRLVENIKVW